MLILGLGHRDGVGKDTVADILATSHGFKKMAFADPLRDTCRALYGWSHKQMTDRDLKETPDPFWGISPRTGLRKVGKELVRDNLGEDHWVKLMELGLNHALDYTSRIVIPDVRFQNEAAFIKKFGGVLWKIDRPGFSDKEAVHESERNLLDYTGWDLIINNNDTQEKLEWFVNKMVSMLKEV